MKDIILEEALLLELTAERQAREAAEQLVAARKCELEDLAVATRPRPHQETEKLLQYLKAPALLTDAEDKVVLLNEELLALLDLPQHPSIVGGVTLQEFKHNVLLRHQQTSSGAVRMTLATVGMAQADHKVLERERLPVAVGTEACGNI